MIAFKNNSVRVRCLECKEEHFIEMKHLGTDKQQRNFGYEYEHIFRGEMKCSHCGDNMRLLTTVFEYPKEIINYVDVADEGCLIMDDIKTLFDFTK